MDLFKAGTSNMDARIILVKLSRMPETATQPSGHSYLLQRRGTRDWDDADFPADAELSAESERSRSNPSVAPVVDSQARRAKVKENLISEF